MTTGPKIIIAVAVATAAVIAGFIIISRRRRDPESKPADAVKPDGSGRAAQNAAAESRQTDFVPRRRVDVATPDSRALRATEQHPFTQKYLQLVGMPEGPRPDLRLDIGALKGVQDAADSWDDFDAWLDALVAACRDGEIKLLVPRIGDKYENTEMLCFTEEEIVTMALAKVTKVLAHGLIRADGTLILRALVEASDEPDHADGANP